MISDYYILKKLSKDFYKSISSSGVIWKFDKSRDLYILYWLFCSNIYVEEGDAV